MTNLKLWIPFNYVFYSIFISILIYFLFISNSSSFNSMYNNLVLNDNEDYLRKYIYEELATPVLYPDNFLIKKGDHYDIDIPLIKKNCPMTIEDVSPENIVLEENNSNSENENQKEQKVIDNFIKDLKTNICGCLKVPEKIFTTSYLCKTIGFSFLMNSKNDNITMNANSENLFMGQINYLASKSLVNVIFKTIQALVIFNVIKLWIQIISYSMMYRTISHNVKVKKTIDEQGNKKVYFDSLKNPNVGVRLFFYGLFSTLVYLLIPIIIQMVTSLQFKSLGNLKNIVHNNITKKIYLYVMFYLILVILFSGIFKSDKNISKIAQLGFNKDDAPFLDNFLTSFDFSLSKNETINFNFIMIQLLILCLVIYLVSISFKSSKLNIIMISCIIFLVAFLLMFQYNNEGTFDDIFKKCPPNNANPYSYQSKLRNKSFWNITSGFIKYNYEYL